MDSYKYLLVLFFVGAFYLLKYVDIGFVTKQSNRVGRILRDQCNENKYVNNFFTYFIQPFILKQFFVLMSTLTSFLEGVMSTEDALSDIEKRIQEMNSTVKMEMSEDLLVDSDSESSLSSDDTTNVVDIDNDILDNSKLNESESSSDSEIEVNLNLNSMIDNSDNDELNELENMNIDEFLSNITAAFSKDMMMNNMVDSDSINNNMVNPMEIFGDNLFNMNNFVSELEKKTVQNNEESLDDNLEMGELLDFSDNEEEKVLEDNSVSTPIEEQSEMDKEDRVLENNSDITPTEEKSETDKDEQVLSDPKESKTIDEMMIDNSEDSDEIENYSGPPKSESKTVSNKGKFTAEKTGNSIKIKPRKKRGRKKKQTKK